MDTGEQFVERWLRGRGLSVDRYSVSELTKGRKSPDFKVRMADGKLAFLCEVKSLMDRSESENMSDPLPNKITKNIHEAYKQFQSVNSSHDIPNVLVFVSFDMAAGVDYLDDVITGSWVMTNGDVLDHFKKYAFGVIKNEKREIDLYVWFDSPDHYSLRFMTEKDSARFSTLCRALQIEEGNVSARGG